MPLEFFSLLGAAKWCKMTALTMPLKNTTHWFFPSSSSWVTSVGVSVVQYPCMCNITFYSSRSNFRRSEYYSFLIGSIASPGDFMLENYSVDLYLTMGSRVATFGKYLLYLPWTITAFTWYGPLQGLRSARNARATRTQQSTCLVLSGLAPPSYIESEYIWFARLFAI